MRSKLLPILWLVLIASGCERKAGTGVATDTSTGDTAPAPSPGKPEILSVTLRVRAADGRVGNVEVDLDSKEGADALFLSMDAIEKFAVPFYERTQGADSVAALRKRAREELDRYGIVIGIHKKLCYIVMPGLKWGGKFPFEL